MTPEDFRSIVLAIPGATESAHMHHPDFRREGRIFATLGYPDEGWGLVKLSPDQQRHFLTKAPGVFDVASGAWGRSGSTVVRLDVAGKAVVKAAILAAFKNAAARKKHASPAVPALPSVASHAQRGPRKRKRGLSQR
jgi:hypothetical protein